jgi:hypothetical protein
LVGRLADRINGTDGFKISAVNELSNAFSAFKDECPKEKYWYFRKG